MNSLFLLCLTSLAATLIIQPDGIIPVGTVGASIGIGGIIGKFVR